LRKIIINTLYALFLIVLFSGSVWAAPNVKGNENKNLPSLERFQINQMGDSEAFIMLYGKKLPTPELILNEKLHRIEIIFKNSLNNVPLDPLPTETPMISSIEVEQRSKDAVIIIQSAEDNFVIKELRGAGPSDRFSVVFATQQLQKRINVENQLKETRLPPIPLIADFQKSSPVTIDVRDIPLTDVVRMMAEATKRNVVIDKSLPNEYVTMTLKQVPLNVAVEHLKRMYDIDFAMMGNNTIIAGSRGGLARMTGREVTRAFKVAYADVKSIPAILTGVMRLSDLELRNITVDERLRQIYITSSPERLEEITVALQTLDNPGKQIMLHARIFEFNDAYTKEVDSMVNAIYDNWWLNYTQGNIYSGFLTDSGINPVRTAGASPGSTVLPPVLGTEQPIAPLPQIIDGTWRMIDAAFKFTEEKNIGKVLANPSVITYDGQEAKIQLTQEHPYRVAQTGSGGDTLYTTEFIEAGPIMAMRPKIGRDGVITIELNLEASEFIGTTATNLPIKSKRQVQSNVRVRHGEPFIVGGLHREIETKVKSKIPILGDIPLLGSFFRYASNVSNKTQVVMLVVPYILDTPDSKIEAASLLFRR
jgi:type IV pilus assembly protein PilQ